MIKVDIRKNELNNQKMMKSVKLVTKKKMYIAVAAFIMAAGFVASPFGVRVDMVNAAEQSESDINVGENNTEPESGNTGEVQNDSTHYLNIGSVSKMYVVTAAMQLVDQGKVDLDAPVTEYITDFKMADERYKDITVRMLMNHTSGLMGSMYGGGFTFDEKSSKYHDEFLKLLSKERLKYNPGQYNCYCNDGFTLLEILVERVSGMTFSDYLEKNICRSISISNTGTMWSVPDFDAQVPIYTGGNIQMEPEIVHLIGAGGIMSSAEDVCAFGSSFFSGNNALLSEKSKQEMAKDYGTSADSFGLGWDMVSRKDYEDKGVSILQKGGDTNFQHSSLTVAPDEEISVAVVSSGGSSGVDEDMALKLLDIALLEKGITVEHPEKEAPALADRVPDEYGNFAGQYANANMVVDISFPDMKYMLLRSLTNNEEFALQYMYTADGGFVKMSGDVESGNAIPAKPVEILDFEQKDGSVYVREPGGGYALYKIPENNVSDKVISAWENRNGVSYYYYNGNASDGWYLLSSNCVTLNTSEEAKGYVNGCTIIDENHAENRITIPDSASRDVTDMEIRNEDGCEILSMTDQNMEYISEKNIPEFTESITEVSTEAGAAKWFRIEGLENETVKFDIPDGAAVYVYDQYGNVKYSSLMKEYNAGVPLPEYGMIVFVGDTGLNVGIRR